MSLEIYSDAYLTMTLDRMTGIVRYVRSPTPYPSVEEARVVHSRALESIPAASSNLKLLLDVRNGPSRNDAEFEKAILGIMTAFLPRFITHVFLVRTAAGKLQTRRLAGTRGLAPPAVFDDEAAAIRHLSGFR